MTRQRVRVEGVSDTVSAREDATNSTGKAGTPISLVCSQWQQGSQAATGLCASLPSRFGEVRGMCRCVVCAVLCCLFCTLQNAQNRGQRTLGHGKRCWPPCGCTCKRPPKSRKRSKWKCRSERVRLLGANMGVIGARPEASRHYSHCALYRGCQPEPPAHPCPPCDSQAQFRLHSVRRAVPKKKETTPSIAPRASLPLIVSQFALAVRTSLSAAVARTLPLPAPFSTLRLRFGHSHSCPATRSGPRARPPVALTSLDYPAATC